MAELPPDADPEAVGAMLHAMLTPPPAATPRPPFVHTYTVTMLPAPSRWERIRPWLTRRRRTRWTGWLVNGRPVSLREGWETYSLRPADVPPPRRDLLRSWWRAKRAQWARRIAP